MKRMKLLSGHQEAMPYLVIKNAENFIDFIKRIFNAQEKVRKVDPQHQIQYAEVTVGSSTLLISEASPSYPAQCISMFVYVPDADQTYYDALEEGAKPLMSPLEEDNNARSAGFQDPFGNTWWLSTLN